MPGLAGSILGNGPLLGAFWNGGSARRNTNSSYSALHAAVNSVVLSSKEPLAKVETGTLPGVSSCSSSSSSPPPCSSSSSAFDQVSTTTAAADAATAEAACKKVRRVTWSPMVLAREEAAAFIRSSLERYIEAEDSEYRAAYSDEATSKSIERWAEERAERERGGVPSTTTCRPVAKRGAFFGLLACLYKPEWMGYKMWPQDPFFASAPLLLKGGLLPAALRGGGGGGGTSAPLSRASTLGDAVRGMAVSMHSRGQSRA